MKLRLTLLVAGAALTVSTTALVLLSRDLNAEISNAITTELEVRARDIAATLDSGALIDDGGFLAQTLAADGRVIDPSGTPALLTANELARARAGAVTHDRPVTGIGEHARLVAIAVEDPTDAVAVVAVAGSTASLERARSRLELFLVVGIPGLALVAGGASWVLIGAALRPVRRMTSEARSISLQSPGRRLPIPPGEDEIAELARTLNGMLGRIETTLAGERRFIDDASHELRTPIAVIRGELELAMLEADDPGAVERAIRSALEEVDQLGELARNLLLLARADAGEPSAGTDTVDVGQRLRGVADRLPRPPGTAIDVYGPGRSVAVRSSGAWIDLLATNLLENGLRHAASRVRVEVEAGPQWVKVLVADDGPGFGPEVMERVFERFVRGDRGEGAGLGLSIAWSIATALGGSIAAGNGPPLGGAWVEVTLPEDRTLGECAHHAAVGP